MAEKINPRERARWMVGLGVKSGSRCAVVLGEGLRAWRAEQGLTQKQAADRAKVSDSIWATWETGRGLPGEVSWRLVRKAVGEETTLALIGAVEREARTEGAGEPGAVKAKVVAKARPKGKGAVPVPDGWGGWQPEPEKDQVRGADTDGVIGAVLACGLGDREKALLCAAVIAMAAGVGVEVEIKARV